MGFNGCLIKSLRYLSIAWSASLVVPEAVVELIEAVLIKFDLGWEMSLPATVVSVRLNGNLKALWTVVPCSSNVEGDSYQIVISFL